MADRTDDEIGTLVRQARESRGLTREQFALLAKVSTSMVTRLELQHRLPKAQSLGRIARALDLSLDELVENRPHGRDEGRVVASTRPSTGLRDRDER